MNEQDFNNKRIAQYSPMIRQYIRKATFGEPTENVSVKLDRLEELGEIDIYASSVKEVFGPLEEYESCREQDRPHGQTQFLDGYARDYGFRRHPGEFNDDLRVRIKEAIEKAPAIGHQLIRNGIARPTDHFSREYPHPGDRIETDTQVIERLQDNFVEDEQWDQIGNERNVEIIASASRKNIAIIASDEIPEGSIVVTSGKHSGVIHNIGSSDD